MVIQDGGQERNWLVKSSTRILGPFSVDDVAQLLLKKHISIIDEVRQPRGRWRYIREHDIFDEVVVALRAEQANSHELTQTSTATATMSSGTAITRTDVTTDGDTPAPGAPRASPETPASPPVAVKSDFKEAVVLSVRDAVPVSARSGGGIPAGGSYGSIHDQRVRNQLSGSVKTALWALAGAAAVVFLGLAGWKLHHDRKRSLEYDHLTQSVLRLRGEKLYAKAIEFYRKAEALRAPSPQLQEQMALPLIVLERQNVAGRRILEQVAEDANSGRGQIIDALLGVSISHVLDGNLREAEESLQKILILEPANVNARINLATIALRKGEWETVERRFSENGGREASLHPLSLLARGVALVESGEWRNAEKSGPLITQIRAHFERSELLRQELALIRLVLTPEEDPSAAAMLGDFLSRLSGQSQLYARDLRLDWKAADWDLLERQCRQYIARAADNPRIKSFHALCKAESGGDADSRRLMEEALAAAPKDPWVLFTQANLLHRWGLRQEAFAVLRMPELTGLPSTDVLTGQICLEQGDLACAERSFRVAKAGRHRSIIPLAGLAEILTRQGREQEAEALTREGLEREPLYLPLIELQESQGSAR